MTASLSNCRQRSCNRRSSASCRQQHQMSECGQSWACSLVLWPAVLKRRLCGLTDLQVKVTDNVALCNMLLNTLKQATGSMRSAGRSNAAIWQSTKSIAAIAASGNLALGWAGWVMCILL